VVGLDLDGRAILGSRFIEVEPVWSMRPHGVTDSPNDLEILRRVKALVETTRQRLARGKELAAGEQGPYEDLVLYHLYYRHEPTFARVLERSRPARAERLSYREFVAEVNALLAVPGVAFPSRQDPAHLYACFFQVRRAFHHIFHHIVGGSMPAARLRAAVWQSIFTHDMRRYRRALHARMGDVTTLVTGPSGTGKELVARAIGLSRYIPLDAVREAFREDYAAGFHPLNLSALSPTLIESELFGHRRGAFTGALEDRAGWLEVCPPLGTVFLDEIGELDGAIQVKLLRVIEGRTFQRLGETTSRRFEGKVIAATNRDLLDEMEAGRFRRDLYYRLCSDIIRTPSLKEQLEGSRGELERLVAFIAERIAGESRGRE
jgi:hypothetical protein